MRILTLAAALAFATSLAHAAEVEGGGQGGRSKIVSGI
jgi:hypothetical protein